MMAQQLGIAFVPARKKGKLPGDLYSETYSLEYGTVGVDAVRIVQYLANIT